MLSSIMTILQMRYYLFCQGSLLFDCFLGISDRSLHNMVNARSKSFSSEHLQKSNVALSGEFLCLYKIRTGCIFNYERMLEILFNDYGAKI